jgi:hypothetical protein
MGSSAVTEARSIFPHGYADFGFPEPGGYRAPATVSGARGSGHNELFSLIGAKFRSGRYRGDPGEKVDGAAGE